MAPIHDAVRLGDLKEVKRLIEADPALMEMADDTDGGRTPLILACRNDHIDIAEYLLDQGVDIEARDLELGRTALVHACVGDHRAIAALLLRRGVDVNVHDGYGCTPLILATADGHDEIIKLLLKEKELDINATEEGTHWTALHSAVWNERSLSLRLLLDAGADVRIVDVSGRTALVVATGEGHEEGVKLLEVSS